MPKYVLHYFDVAGRGELIRMLFHQAGVEFEDRRIKREEWAELKKNENAYPFGQMPVLEIDGFCLAQSDAIARYLGNEFGLNGKTNLEKAKTDMLCDGLRDIGQHAMAFFRENDEARKAEMKKAFFEEHLPKGLKLYEEKFAPKDGFFLGDELSLVDIALMSFIDMCDSMQKGNVDNFPLLKALCDRVRESPKIKKYLESKKA